MKTTMTDRWDDVEAYTKLAVLIAWDTCHKIYLAMDETQADWFREAYAPDTYEGTPEEMFAKIKEWYEVSCGLRFVSAVRTNSADPNEGFYSLIPQFAEDDDDDDDDEWE
jgi:hypothetical protein